MPVYLRNWYINELQTTMKKESDEMKKQTKKGNMPVQRR
tara:strand:+ start:1461 stop:1577 length:117 start_codon:yes stop_codon:yes gene_type:complete